VNSRQRRRFRRLIAAQARRCGFIMARTRRRYDLPAEWFRELEYDPITAAQFSPGASDTTKRMLFGEVGALQLRARNENHRARLVLFEQHGRAS